MKTVGAYCYITSLINIAMYKREREREKEKNKDYLILFIVAAVKITN
jgi:hypothetical protein